MFGTHVPRGVWVHAPPGKFGQNWCSEIFFVQSETLTFHLLSTNTTVYPNILSLT